MWQNKSVFFMLLAKLWNALHLKINEKIKGISNV